MKKNTIILLLFISYSFVVGNILQAQTEEGDMGSEQFGMGSFSALGIGVDKPFYPLHISKTHTNKSEVMSYFEHTKKVTTNGEFYNRGLHVFSKVNIADEIYDAGHYVGLRSSAYRYLASDKGTLKILSGMDVYYGHWSNIAASAKTVNAYGIALRGLSAQGTIENMYAVYINHRGDLTNIRNMYGIYQVGPTFKNYLEGTLYIGTKETPTSVPSGADLSNYKVFVDGSALIDGEVRVENPANWPDYVFEKDYPLSSLKEVEQFIEQNGHLPNTPSASQMETDGSIELGNIAVIQQEKIEELFLHAIALEKENKAQKIAIQQLNTEKDLLKQQMHKVLMRLAILEK